MCKLLYYSSVNASFSNFVFDPVKRMQVLWIQNVNGRVFVVDEVQEEPDLCPICLTKMDGAHELSFLLSIFWHVISTRWYLNNNHRTWNKYALVSLGFAASGLCFHRSYHLLLK